jgi:hypothetical protein
LFETITEKFYFIFLFYLGNFYQQRAGSRRAAASNLPPDRLPSGDQRRNTVITADQQHELQLHERAGPPYPGPNPRNPALPLDNTVIVP